MPNTAEDSSAATTTDNNTKKPKPAKTYHTVETANNKDINHHQETVQYIKKKFNKYNEVLTAKHKLFKHITNT